MSELAVAGNFLAAGEESFAEIQANIIEAIRDGVNSVWRCGGYLAEARAKCDDADACIAEGITGRNPDERFSKFVSFIVNDTKVTQPTLWRYRRLYEEFNSNRSIPEQVGVTACYEVVKEDYDPVRDDVIEILTDRIEAGTPPKGSEVKAIAKELLRNHKAKQRAGIEAPATCEFYLGDCVDVVSSLEVRPHLVITDPPYGIDVHNTRGGTKDYADGQDYALTLLDKIAAALAEKCADDAHLYFFSGYTFAWEFRQILSRHFDVQENPIIWVKENHTMCDFSQWYPNKHEYIWFCKMRGSRRELLRCVPDVLNFKRQNDTDHSAEKPVDLLRLLVEQSSTEGEIVIDPFVGSGSTGVAAHRLNRSFIGVDVSQEWLDVAKSRLA